MRCSSSRVPSTTARSASTDSSRSPASGSSSATASVTTAPTSVSARGGVRPESARASSSRSPTSRRIRRDERSAESAVDFISPSSCSESSSRLASTLVSGVRSSCEASATNARWRTSIASVSPRAWSSDLSMPSRVRASSATSSSAAGWGTRRLGSRVRSISRATDVSWAMGLIARREMARPARRASPAPPRIPSARKNRTLSIVCSMSDSGRAYWRIAWPSGNRRMTRDSTR